MERSYLSKSEVPLDPWEGIININVREIMGISICILSGSNGKLDEGIIKNW